MKKNITHRWRGLLDAVKHNDENAVKHWVEVKRNQITQRNIKKETAAHLAVGNDNVSLLKYLLQRDQDKFLIRATDSKGLTIFHVAALEGAINVIKLLGDEFEETSLFEPTRKSPKNNVLHLAAKNGHLNVLKYLVEKKNGDVNSPNDFKETPIFIAAQNQRLDIIHYLVEQCNANVMLKDSRNSTILHVASCRNDSSIAEYLLDDRRIELDLNAKNNYGETCLHKAATFNNLNFVRYFIDKKNVDVNVGDIMNKTALYQAALLGHVDMVKCLIEHGADDEITDCMGKKPIEVTQCEEVIVYLKKSTRKRSSRSVDSTFSILPKNVVPVFFSLIRNKLTDGKSRSMSVSTVSSNPQSGNFLTYVSNPNHREIPVVELFAIEAVNEFPRFIEKLNHIE